MYICPTSRPLRLLQRDQDLRRQDHANTEVQFVELHYGNAFPQMCLYGSACCGLFLVQIFVILLKNFVLKINVQG